MANPNIVSVSSIKGESVGFNLTATTTTTLMTVASNKVVKVNRITVANVDGTNAADCTCYFFDSSDSNRYSLATTISVPADSTLVLLGKDAPIYLEEGDQIEGGASAASDLAMIISYEELDDA